MTSAEIRELVLSLLHRVAPEYDLSRIDPDRNLREVLEIDSFDFLNLMVGIHDRLGLTVPESDYSRVSTLNSMVSYLEGAERRRGT